MTAEVELTDQSIDIAGKNDSEYGISGSQGKKKDNFLLNVFFLFITKQLADTKTFYIALVIRRQMM